MSHVRWEDVLVFLRVWVFDPIDGVQQLKGALGFLDLAAGL